LVFPGTAKAPQVLPKKARLTPFHIRGARAKVFTLLSPEAEESSTPDRSCDLEPMNPTINFSNSEKGRTRDTVLNLKVSLLALRSDAEEERRKRMGSAGRGKRK